MRASTPKSDRWVSPRMSPSGSSGSAVSRTLEVRAKCRPNRPMGRYGSLPRPAW
ncbi:hypothetical protein SAVERM_510 [Streptomyces avermitilis MA-4680 = NBRC 14893]|uniref:Uncharacterized protein n=1 Tax=Streptomyces avermitilis (strain ATCC 31267 / DSM 46492 / JCM 5070 / NBRC 14893 / NCIMB 12804 / NRRL 8165 / MA-4680) TaxID=227882 RepID=Q82QJ6_STRAW|nr:hypothetical protein SAVERM_510 [Streptomyces avermitilis MA-4680 = NBRC 14893]